MNIVFLPVLCLLILITLAFGAILGLMGLIGILSWLVWFGTECYTALYQSVRYWYRKHFCFNVQIMNYDRQLFDTTYIITKSKLKKLQWEKRSGYWLRVVEYDEDDGISNIKKVNIGKIDWEMLQKLCQPKYNGYDI